MAVSGGVSGGDSGGTPCGEGGKEVIVSLAGKGGCNATRPNATLSEHGASQSRPCKVRNKDLTRAHVHALCTWVRRAGLVQLGSERTLGRGPFRR